MSANPATCHLVILVHGIGAISWIMTPLGMQLARRGFRTRNWGYWSWGRTIEGYARQLGQLIERAEADPGITDIHLIGHSMGAIVCRAAATSRDWHKLRRLVMLAPPNRGSVVARYAARWLGWLSPAIGDMSDEPTSYVNRLAWPERYETAVLTASRDILVAESSTHVPGQRIWRQYPGRHSTFLYNREVADLIAKFLLTGELSEGPDSGEKTPVCESSA